MDILKAPLPLSTLDLNSTNNLCSTSEHPKIMFYQGQMRFALVTLGLFGSAIVSAAPGSPLNITSVNGDSGCHW